MFPCASNPVRITPLNMPDAGHSEPQRGIPRRARDDGGHGEPDKECGLKIGGHTARGAPRAVSGPSAAPRFAMRSRAGLMESPVAIWAAEHYSSGSEPEGIPPVVKAERGVCQWT